MESVQNRSPPTATSSDPTRIWEDLMDLKEFRQVLQGHIEQAEACEGLWETEKLRLRNRKEVMLDADDVLDEWRYELLRGGSSDISTADPQLETNILTADPELRKRMADQIWVVKQKRYDVNAIGTIRGEGDGSPGSQPAGGARSSSLLANDHVYKDAMVEYLVDVCAKNDLTVFPIAGMALAGKTTLASAISDDSEVKKHFDPRGCASFGTNFDLVDLLRGVTEALTDKACQLKQLDRIVTNLRTILTGKRLLLVLDGVHLQHLEVWDHLKDSLSSSCSKGSVVLVTTRDGNVADKVRTIEDPPTLYLDVGISDDSCWRLFKRYASGGHHSVEEDLREKVVEQCRELLLAAKLLGSSFRHYRGDRMHWAADSMERVIEENVRPALKSSYLQLAPHLKPCLLYCSLFPQGYQFSKEQLVRLWMAQGLLDPRTKIERILERAEDVGLRYFDELVSGSFVVQDPDDCTQYFIPKFIWDLLNDLSGEEEYMEYVRRADIDMGDPLWRCRHLLLNPQGCSSFKLDPDSFFDSPGLRSLLFMPRFKLPLKIQDQDLSSLKRLRTLDLSNTSVSELPESVGGLKHLRFLVLNHTGIRKLPESVSKLYNLQVLELKNCYWLEKLPSGVGNLVNLRYLDRGDDLPRVNMPKEIRRLTNLQSLAGLDLQKDDESFCGLRELKDLNKLTKLGVSGLCNLTDPEDATEASLLHKTSIKILKLRWCSDEDDAAAKAEQFKGIDYENFYNLRGMTGSEDGHTANEAQRVVDKNSSEWNPSDYSNTLFEEADEDEDTNFTENEEDVSGSGSIPQAVGAEQMLEALKPYTTVEELELRTYPGLQFPGWIGDPSFSNLISVVLKDCACEALPPLGQLPQLEVLSIDGMPVKAVGALNPGCIPPAEDPGSMPVKAVGALNPGCIPPAEDPGSMPVKAVGALNPGCIPPAEDPGSMPVKAVGALNPGCMPPAEDPGSMPVKAVGALNPGCIPPAEDPGSMPVKAVGALNPGCIPPAEDPGSMPVKAVGALNPGCIPPAEDPGSMPVKAVGALNPGCIPPAEDPGSMPVKAVGALNPGCMPPAEDPGSMPVKAVGALNPGCIPPAEDPGSMPVKAACEEPGSIPPAEDPGSMPVKAACEEPGSIPPAEFPNLRKLAFYNMREWTAWNGVKDGDFPMLEELILFNCPKLRRLPNSGSALPSLQVLDIDRSRALSEIPDLPSLTSLELCRCDSLTSIPSLGSLSSLTVAHSRSLESLPTLGKLDSLWVEDCERLGPIAASSFLNPSAERPKKLLVTHFGELLAFLWPSSAPHVELIAGAGED